MFWERYEALCHEAGISPSGAEMRRVIGVSTGAIPSWKKGVIPEHKRLKVIADYFQTSVSYLLGDSDERHAPAQQGNKKSPASEGRGDGVMTPERVRIEKAIDGLSLEELLEAEKYIAYLKSQRNPQPR